MEWLYVGLVAGALTSTSFVPQIVKGWRTKKLADVSPGMLGVMFAGLTLWEAYGWARADVVLVLANAVGLVCTGALLGLWWRYGRLRPSGR
jgi:MtN3 and saliva related transmembrane protein